MTMTPEEAVEEIMSGWTWDGMPAEQLEAVRHFAIAAIAARDDEMVRKLADALMTTDATVAWNVRWREQAEAERDALAVQVGGFEAWCIEAGYDIRAIVEYYQARVVGA